jgi:hypothetical protein
MSTFCAHLKKEEVNGQKQKQIFNFSCNYELKIFFQFKSLALKTKKTWTQT